MTYYDKFSIVNVFEDPRLNVFLNQLITGLINAYPKDDILGKLLVDGRVALIMQEVAEIPNSFTKIEFSTSDQEIFRYLKLCSKIFTVTELLSTDNLIILKTQSNHNLYFNLVSKPMEAVNIQKVYVRKSSEII